MNESVARSHRSARNNVVQMEHSNGTRQKNANYSRVRWISWLSIRREVPGAVAN